MELVQVQVLQALLQEVVVPQFVQVVNLYVAPVKSLVVLQDTHHFVLLKIMLNMQCVTTETQ